MNKTILTFEDIPDAEKDPEFWSVIQSEAYKKVANLLLLNEVRRYNPAELTNESCRSQLAKIKAFQEMIDLPQILLVEKQTVEEE